MAPERYIEVCFYGDRGDPSPPNNYRPEIVAGDLRLLPLNVGEQDFATLQEHNGCIPKDEANAIADRIAKALGIEVRLAE